MNGTTSEIVDEFIEDFLEHYASEYYDPNKAREYYLRTRELKGRQKSSDLKSDAKKEAWSKAKAQNESEKQSALQLHAEKNRRDLALIRGLSQMQRQRIVEKFKDIFKKLSEEVQSESEDLAAKRKQDLEKISADAQSKIAALPPIPDGVSAKRKAELTAIRAKEIDKIRGDANTAKTAVNDAHADAVEKASEKTSDKREFVKTLNAGERDAVRDEMKKSLDRARSNYTAIKDRVRGEYEEKAQSQYESIRTSTSRR